VSGIQRYKLHPLLRNECASDVPVRRRHNQDRR